MYKNNLFICVLALLLLSFTKGSAQDCDKIRVDIKKGTINKLRLSASQEDVKKKLPCSTGSTADGESINCGGGVFFFKHQFYFYTGRDYLNVRKGFKGELSIPLLDMTEAAAIEKLGKIVRTEKPGTRKFIFFKASYGCIVLEITGENIAQVYLYKAPAEEVKLCI